ncbi:hypothetical protein PHLCEN_2v4532 [Hermanssonia centrifuga]|uniref:Uncharacterized protein n=1 Tax=Hermanssonia centrifuga TaxID=98765 RepID=A0A2R6PNL1_9APHY|nr:hypothetical protein PHLCEN_2v4532 [Hermanssonia centrifuga]
MARAQTFTKVDLTPKKHHGYSVLLFIFGTLFPPLGHAHNFYIQNVRNNKNNRRTPKWIQKYGLVDTSEIKRKERKSQWAGRYNERLPHSVLEEQPYEEGQDASSSVDVSVENEEARRGELWNPNEEQYYGQNGDRSSASIRTNGSGGRWRYPANFEDAVAEPSRKKSSKKKKEKKDRWARTEDAYSIGESGSTSRRKKSKKRKSTADPSTYSHQSDSTTDFPEDAEGGLYGDTRPAPEPAAVNGRGDADQIFTHEF